MESKSQEMREEVDSSNSDQSHASHFSFGNLRSTINLYRDIFIHSSTIQGQ